MDPNKPQRKNLKGVSRRPKTKKQTNYWIPGGGGIHNPPDYVLDIGKKWVILWRMLKRWQQRIIKIENQNTGGVLSLDLVDYAHAFMVFCFAMRDWLIKTKQSQEAELANLFKNHIELKVCRDISNGLKHLVLDKPSISGELGIHREYDHFTERAVLKITFFGPNQKKYDWEVLDFVNECMKIWEKFLSSKYLLPLGEK